MRAGRIVKGWAEQKAVRGIMLFLHGHGVGTSGAVRVFKTYSADAVQVIAENPEGLANTESIATMIGAANSGTAVAVDA